MDGLTRNAVWLQCSPTSKGEQLHPLQVEKPPSTDKAPPTPPFSTGRKATLHGQGTDHPHLFLQVEKSPSQTRHSPPPPFSTGRQATLPDKAQPTPSFLYSSVVEKLFGGGKQFAGTTAEFWKAVCVESKVKCTCDAGYLPVTVSQSSDVTRPCRQGTGTMLCDFQKHPTARRLTAVIEEGGHGDGEGVYGHGGWEGGLGHGDDGYGHGHDGYGHSNGQSVTHDPEDYPVHTNSSYHIGVEGDPLDRVTGYGPLSRVTGYRQEEYPVHTTSSYHIGVQGDPAFEGDPTPSEILIRPTTDSRDDLFHADHMDDHMDDGFHTDHMDDHMEDSFHTDHMDDHMHGDEEYMRGDEKYMHGNEEHMHGGEKYMHGDEEYMHGDEEYMHGDEEEDLGEAREDDRSHWGEEEEEELGEASEDLGEVSEDDKSHGEEEEYSEEASEHDTSPPRRLREKRMDFSGPT